MKQEEETVRRIVVGQVTTTHEMAARALVDQIMDQRDWTDKTAVRKALSVLANDGFLRSYRGDLGLRSCIAVSLYTYGVNPNGPDWRPLMDAIKALPS